MHIHKPHTHSSQTHKPPLRYMPFPLCTFTQAHARSTKSSTLLSILFSASVSVSILTPLVCRNFRFQRVLLQWVEERCKLLPGCFFQLLCMSLKWDALKLMCFTVFFTSITSFSLEAIYLFSVCQRMFFKSPLIGMNQTPKGFTRLRGDSIPRKKLELILGLSKWTR